MRNSDWRGHGCCALKRFAAGLNLSEDQKTRLRSALESAREKLDEVRKNNPDITRADIIAKLKEARSPLRERVQAWCKSIACMRTRFACVKFSSWPRIS